MNQRRRLAVVCAAVCAAAVLLGACALVPDLPRPERSTASSPSSTASPSAVQLGLTRYAAAERALLPALGGTTLDGSRLDLSSLRGRVVVVNAWASWCEPCKEELPVLAELARTPGSEVAFVGLDVDDQRDGARAMAAAYRLAYPSIVDERGALLRQVPGVPPTAVPSTVVLDRQGRVAARVIGAVHPGVLEPVLAALVTER